MQGAASAGRPVSSAAPAWLARMLKPRSPASTGRGVCCRASMRASGGGAVRSRRVKACTAAGGPWISHCRPAASLRTQPLRPSSAASCTQYGRKPTPCTAPRRCRCSRSAAAQVGSASAADGAAREAGAVGEEGEMGTAQRLARQPWAASFASSSATRARSRASSAASGDSAGWSPCRSQSSQASMPWPFLAETSSTSMPGLTRRA